MAAAQHDILRHLQSLFSKDRDNDDDLQIMDYFPAIVYVIDVQDKKTTYINQGRMSDVLGFTRREIQNWNSDMMKMIFAEDEELVRAELAKCLELEDDADHSFSNRLNHADGNWRYFRTRGRVLKRNENGTPSSLLFLSEDITDETQSQEEITALRKLVDDTEELLLFGSWSVDIATEHLTWTDGMYTLLDYPKKEQIADLSLDFYLKHLSTEDSAAFRHALSKAKIEKNSFEIKHHLTTNSGETKFISTKGKVVLDGERRVSKVVGISRDITKQTKINQDLQNYRSTILEKEEFLNQGSWEIDLLSGDMSWSEGMARLFGVDNESGDARNAIVRLLEQTLVHEDGSRMQQEEMQGFFRNKDHYSTEGSIKTKEGQERQIETFVKVIKNHVDEPQSLIGTCRDITQLKEYERSLEEKINELKRSNQDLEEFAYVASHDLQEPLRKLTTFSERLQTKFKGQLGDDGMLYLDRIVAATENMRLLIDNLLDFSRTTTIGKHFSPIDVNKVLKDALSGLELKIEETGVQIHVDKLPAIDGISSQIKQLFENLVSNSLKFMRKNVAGTISINCDVASPKEIAEYALKPDKVYYKFSIHDNGIGFENEYHEKIFLIFQRLHGKAEYPGTGIGLAICKKIVENHNGVIFAVGNPGKGATFSFFLPENQF